MSSYEHISVFWACFSILSIFRVSAGPLLSSDVSNITRIEEGDTFAFRGGECVRRECGGRTESLSCQCACPAHAPLFREDTGECVDDITECSVAPFGTGISAQRIPFVFLPLKGQIIHPSKEISFPGVKTPICAVSGAQFLTRNGFIDLRNSADSDVPFSLFRDEGRTFLQWTGEQEMRSRMEGRLLVVQLLCRDVSITPPKGTDVNNRALHGVFTPCAAFRVAGSPSKHIPNVSEVLFSTDNRYSDNSSVGLSMNEYIAIGISSILLGLIYVASVFLYLHIKKKKNGKPTVNEPPPEEFKITKNSKRESIRKEIELGKRPMMINLNSNEPGVVKNNPLLHFNGAERDKMGHEFAEDSISSPSDPDEGMEEIIIDKDPKGNNNQGNQITTSATIHPSKMHHEPPRRILERYSDVVHMYREEPSIERLPEDPVSIIETLEERPEHVRAVGTTRKKLYFNPAFFEPQMLLDPPPAAIEFLVKIREVISIAKHKMASKRFTPSLKGIPEEESYLAIDRGPFHHVGSHRSSAVSLKRENVRRKSHCSGCPGCSRENIVSQIPEINHLGACHSCTSNFGVNKQVSVRKWLEGVPMSKNPGHFMKNESDMMPDTPNSGSRGMLNSMLSLPKDRFDFPRKYYDFTSRSLYAEDTTNNFVFKKKVTTSVKSEPSHYSSLNIPLPNLTNVSKGPKVDHPTTIAKMKSVPPVGMTNKSHHEKSKKVDRKKLSPPPPPPTKLNNSMPDMINEALVVDKSKVIPNQNKNGAAVISALSKPQPLDKEKSDMFAHSIEKLQHIIDYETDSLERTSNNNNKNTSKGRSTPTDYADVPSSEPSPSLSTALPLEEELTIKNATYKVNHNKAPYKELPKEPIEIETGKNIASKVKANHTANVFENHTYHLTDLKNRKIPDYNLVTEVYVNNGYNFGSGPTSPSESDSSTFGKRKPTIKYDSPKEKPGHLTIEVQDPPENYIKIHESDGFEPDTLDRKPNKTKINIVTERGFILNSTNNLDIKPTGIFKTASLSFSNGIGNALQNNKTFGSLRNVYESKVTLPSRPSIQNVAFAKKEDLDNLDYEIVDNPPLTQIGNTVIDSEEGRLLTLEMRHSKRQRQSTPPSQKCGGKLIPPDVIPPDEAIYEYPKPPRLVNHNGAPPLPPKNDNGRSPSSRSELLNKVTLELSSDMTFFSGNSNSVSLGLQRSPSGTSVHSVQSSDYESVIPPRDVPCIPPPVPSHNKPKLPPPNPKPDSLESSEKTETPKKFRQFQTPKAGRKIRQNVSQRKKDKEKGKFKATPYKEDSGYLSSDSNEFSKNTKKKANKDSGSESDESNEDARSESGAESIETHSVFFGSFRKMSMISGSVDSGMGSESSRFRNMISPSPERHFQDTEDRQFVTLDTPDNLRSRNSITISDC